MNFQIADALEMLQRSPKSIRELVSGLSPSWSAANEGEGTWNAPQILAHLVVAEQHWSTRVSIALSDREDRSLPPFDVAMQQQLAAEKSLDQLVEEFLSLRQQNLDLIAHTTIHDSDLSRRVVHPSLGSVSLENILASWTAHDMAHLVQLGRVFAKQYQEAVGPWAQNMSLLRKTAN